MYGILWVSCSISYTFVVRTARTSLFIWQERLTCIQQQSTRHCQLVVRPLKHSWARHPKTPSWQKQKKAQILWYSVNSSQLRNQRFQSSEIMRFSNASKESSSVQLSRAQKVFSSFIITNKSPNVSAEHFFADNVVIQCPSPAFAALAWLVPFPRGDPTAWPKKPSESSCPNVENKKKTYRLIKKCVFVYINSIEKNTMLRSRYTSYNSFVCYLRHKTSRKIGNSQLHWLRWKNKLPAEHPSAPRPLLQEHLLALTSWSWWQHHPPQLPQP